MSKNRINSLIWQTIEEGFFLLQIQKFKERFFLNQERPNAK